MEPEGCPRENNNKDNKLIKNKINKEKKPFKKEEKGEEDKTNIKKPVEKINNNQFSNHQKDESDFQIISYFDKLSDIKQFPEENIKNNNHHQGLITTIPSSKGFKDNKPENLIKNNKDNKEKNTFQEPLSSNKKISFNNNLTKKSNETSEKTYNKYTFSIVNLSFNESFFNRWNLDFIDLIYSSFDYANCEFELVNQIKQNQQEIAEIMKGESSKSLVIVEDIQSNGVNGKHSHDNTYSNRAFYQICSQQEGFSNNMSLESLEEIQGFPYFKNLRLCSYQPFEIDYHLNYLRKTKEVNRILDFQISQLNLALIDKIAGMQKKNTKESMDPELKEYIKALEKKDKSIIRTNSSIKFDENYFGEEKL